MDWASTRAWPLRRLTTLIILLMTFFVSRLLGSDALTAPDSSHARKGIVYVVLAVDTETFHVSGIGKEVELDLSNFLPDTSKIIARVMSPEWRANFTDSFGGHPKFTWFVVTSELICHAAGCLAVFDAMQNFSNDVKQFGDEIGWHYHHTDWHECVSAGKSDSSWIQLVSFDGTTYADGADVELCENVMNQLIADRGFFPVSFRAGWVWENNEFSRWLENVIPFDLSSSPPLKTLSNDSTRCRANESDWSRAPIALVPYHPDMADYQSRGEMKRLVSRSLLKNLTTNELRMLSAFADSGSDAILSIPIHSYSNLRFAFGQKLETVIAQLSRNGTSFKFATCAEAFQPFVGSVPSKQLKLELHQKDGTIVIKANTETFSTQLYVVVRNSSGMLKRAIPRKTGERTWALDLAGLDAMEIYVAGSTLAGESLVQSIVVTPR